MSFVSSRFFVTCAFHSSFSFCRMHREGPKQWTSADILNVLFVANSTPKRGETQQNVVN